MSGTASAMNDNPFDPKLYGDAAISAETRMLNASLVAIMTPLPNWWDIGAEVTREFQMCNC